VEKRIILVEIGTVFKPTIPYTFANEKINSIRMNRPGKNALIVGVCALLLVSQNLVAQTAKTFTLSELLELAIANSKQLKLSQTDVETAKAATKLARTAFSPALDISLSAFYIGNGVIMDRNFSNAKNIEMPHFGNNFGFEASQLIFTGGGIATNIEKSRLEEQIAKLNYDRDELDICFLVTAYYLDLFKFKNQAEVFNKNIEQTELLIHEIKSKESQGMALGSDVTRHELMLQDLKVQLIDIENNSKIINNQLVVTLGLSAETMIIPDASILKMDLSKVNKNNLLQLAFENLPELKLAVLNKEIYAKNIRIVKADYYPQIALVAANNLNGPILIEVPTMNNNFNYWYIGVGIKYNLASLYNTNVKLQLAGKKQLMTEYAEALTMEHAQMAVYSAYTKFKESFEKLSVFEISLRLAGENYRIVNNRYLSDVVLITEMLDASNSKLNAELQLVNARLNVIYNYYSLQREIGNKIRK